MAVRRNAPTSPAPSRRNFLGQIAIAAAGLASVAAVDEGLAFSPPDPDAHLVNLLTAWQVLEARDLVLCHLDDEILPDWHDSVPVPKELRFGKPDPVNGRYKVRSRRDLEELREAHGVLGNLEDVAKQERRLALLGDYEAEIEAALIRTGRTPIKAERKRIFAEQRRLEVEIESTPAAGIAGIAVKLSILFRVGPYDFDLNGDGTPETRMLVATMHDAERLAGLPLSLPSGETREA